ncbi:HD domain-containing protein, partial [bacterium]|nr:HD domain-containing protein [bacterium]
MIKHIHEIRDPIHVFIRLTTDERKVLDSRPFQRLRQIHQLAMTYLVYPGATHRRFEHSLGVMELADRVYNVVTNPNNVEHESVRNILPEYESIEHKYWHRVLKIAALCHDLGHLPFSHAAEEELLPEGWDHERITAEIIRSDEMQQIWKQMIVTPKPDDIIKVAIGPKKARELKFNDWETILSEIIVGDTFGVDRMDYLLRDSLHAGVIYGKFDHYRLIDTLRILPKSSGAEDSTEPTLGLTAGGVQSAEALLWARYFMYSQVYFHPVRRIYDIHLQDFLQKWLKDGRFSTKMEDYLEMTDSEVIVEMRKAALESTHAAHIYAKRIIDREHFKVLYELTPDDRNINPNAAKAVYDAACEKYGKDSVRRDKYTQKGGRQTFPVLHRGKILQSTELSGTLSKIPVVATDFVFID